MSKKTRIFKEKHYLYVLVKESKAVYIGVTKNTVRRTTQHRKNKDFDKLLVLKSFYNKEEALASERSIISFLTYFGDGEWYNSESILDKINRDFYLRKEGMSNG